MDPYLLLALVLLLFVLAAAGPSLLAKERMAWRQGVEILLWGGALLGAAWLTRIASPLLYLLALYLVTMRARLLVEVANALAMRGRRGAQPLYALAGALALNPLDRAVVRVNQGAALLHTGQVAGATRVLEELLAGGQLGNRLGAACRYNLGLAHLRAGDCDGGCSLLRQAVDLMPGSIYAQRARLVLQRLAEADDEVQ